MTKRVAEELSSYDSVSLENSFQLDPSAIQYLGGFLSVPRIILQDESLSVGEIYLWSLMLSYANLSERDAENPDSASYAGNDRLAKECRVSARTVSTWKKSLADKGWIKTQKRGQGFTDLTFISIPVQFLSHQEEKNPQTQTGRIFASRTAESSHNIIEGNKQEDNTLSVSNSPRVDRRELDEGFRKWYAVYPRKVSPDNARAAWAKINPTGEQVERMIEVLRWHIKIERWDEMAKSPSERKFIPHPATYLNGGRWKEEPEELSDKSKYESGFYF